MERWAALESNPQVMTGFARSIGVKPGMAVHDVFGLDPDLLAMVPQPVRALILCFSSAEAKKLGVLRRAAKAKPAAGAPDLSHLWYMAQTPELGNACGTIALIHAIINTDIPVEEGSSVDKLRKDTKDVSPEERASLLDSFSSIQDAHNAGVEAGETAVRASEDVDCHFVAFIPAAGWVVELDGAYQAAPVAHAPLKVTEGEGAAEAFLSQAAEVIRKKYFEALPDCDSFSLMAFAPGE